MATLKARKEGKPHADPSSRTGARVNKKIVVRHRKPAVKLSRPVKTPESLPVTPPIHYDDEFSHSIPAEHQVGLKTSVLIIAGVSVVFAAVIIYLSSAAMPLATTQIALRSSLTKDYISTEYEFKVRYPKNWSFEVNKNPRPGVLEEVIFDNGLDKVAIATTNQVSTSTLFPAPPLDLNLNGTSAIRYHDYDAATGQPLDRVIIKRKDGTYQELLGYGSFFDRIVNSFTILSK